MCLTSYLWRKKMALAVLAKIGLLGMSRKGRITNAATLRWCRLKSQCSRNGRTMIPKPKALWTKMKTGIKPHGFSTSTKQRRKLRPRSAHYAKLMAIYRKRRNIFLREHPQCAVDTTKRSVDVHHVRGRGRYLLDEATWLPVSRKMHTKIHSEPAWAYEHGYLERRG